MNMRSIYANPYKYAHKCDIPFELAKIMCLKQRHFLKEQRKHPMRCPVCNSKNILFEPGSYEEGYGDFLECDDCGETFDCDEVSNAKYASLTGWEDFDPVLYFSNTENKTEGWKEACGAQTHEEWVKFAEEIITGRIQNDNNDKTTFTQEELDAYNESIKIKTIHVFLEKITDFLHSEDLSYYQKDFQKIANQLKGESF